MNYSRIAVGFALVVAGTVGGSELFAQNAKPCPNDGDCPLNRVERANKPMMRGKQNGNRKDMARDNMKKRFAEALFRRLDLSPEQRAELREIKTEQQKARKNWYEKNEKKLTSIRDDMRVARQDGDREELTRLRKKLNNVMKSSPKPSDAIDDVKAILTKDQVKKFEANLKRIRRGWEDRKEGFKDRGREGFEGRRGPQDRGEFAERGRRERKFNDSERTGKRDKWMKDPKNRNKARKQTHENIIDRAIEELDLNQTQRNKIETILESGYKARQNWMQENKNKLRDLRADMAEASREGDKTKAKKLREKLANLLATAPDRKTIRDQVLTILTPEQKEQLNKKIDQLRKRFQEAAKRRQGKERMDRNRGPKNSDMNQPKRGKKGPKKGYNKNPDDYRNNDFEKKPKKKYNDNDIFFF